MQAGAGSRAVPCVMVTKSTETKLHEIAVIEAVFWRNALANPKVP